MNLDRLTQDEHGGPFRSRRGVTRGRNWQRGFRRRNERSLRHWPRSVFEFGGWVVRTYESGFPKVGSHGPLSRALTRLTGDLVIHRAVPIIRQGHRGAKIYPPTIANTPSRPKTYKANTGGGTQAQRRLSKLQHTPIRTILFNCIRDPVSHATRSLYCLDPRPPAGVNSQVPFSKWYLRPFGFK